MKTLAIWELFEKSGFFSFMKRRLKLREEKQKWNTTINDISLNLLIKHLYSEFEELAEGLKENNFSNIQEECADISNCCAFIFSKIEVMRNG